MSLNINNPKLAKLIKACAELPGYEVFRYRDQSGNMQSIDSSDANDYINEIMGNKFTAKDFRTWAGTSLAVKCYKEAKEEIDEGNKKKLESSAIKKVAKELGNTMAVCQ